MKANEAKRVHVNEPSQLGSAMSITSAAPFGSGQMCSPSAGIACEPSGFGEIASSL